MMNTLNAIQSQIAAMKLQRGRAGASSRFGSACASPVPPGRTGTPHPRYRMAECPECSSGSSGWYREAWLSSLWDEPCYFFRRLRRTIIQEALIKLARADRRGFFRHKETRNRRNTVCISRLSSEFVAEKDRRLPKTHLISGSFSIISIKCEVDSNEELRRKRTARDVPSLF